MWVFPGYDQRIQCRQPYDDYVTKWQQSGNHPVHTGLSPPCHKSSDSHETTEYLTLLQPYDKVVTTLVTIKLLMMSYGVCSTSKNIVQEQATPTLMIVHHTFENSKSVNFIDHL